MSVVLKMVIESNQASYSYRADIAKHLVEKGADFKIKDIFGYTPLHWAARNGNFDIVKCLVEKGADVNARGRDGCPPLHYVIGKGRPDIEKYLESKGARRYCSNIESKKSSKKIKVSKKNDNKIGYNKKDNNQLSYKWNK